MAAAEAAVAVAVAAAAAAAAERKQWSGSGSSGGVVVVEAAEVAEDFSLCHVVVVTGFPLLDGVKFHVFSLFFLGMSMPV